MDLYDDITGKTFGRLKVICIDHVKSYKYEYGDTKNKVYKCLCSCGNETLVQRSNIISGHTKSCGCLSSELIKNGLHTTHGKSKTRLYNVYESMLQRCYYKNYSGYDLYGGRGIAVCDEWRDDFSVFRDWALSHGYDENSSYGECTLDRIDVNGDYRPDNCRWANMKQQSLNRRNTIFVDVDGERLTIDQICERYGLNYDTVYQRLFVLKWDVDKTINTPKRVLKKDAADKAS